MDDGIKPGDSISQVSKERSHASSTCRTTHSASSHGSGRSKEQLDLDISTLAIRMNSQEKRAQLKRKKLEIDLDVEQNELKEQMDLAKVEREMLYEDQGSSSSRSAVRAPEQDRRNHPSNADIIFPSPGRKDSESPDRTSDKGLEALYRQQAVMMGALQAPKIELLEFHGDPMSYHSFIRSFEENVEKMYDDGARLARLIHLCKGEAGRAIKCCNLMDPEQGYARARRLLEQRFGV